MLAQMVKKATYRALRNNPRIAWEFSEKSPGSFPGTAQPHSAAKREKLPWFPGIKIGIMAGQETPARDSTGSAEGVSCSSTQQSRTRI